MEKMENVENVEEVVVEDEVEDEVVLAPSKAAESSLASLPEASSRKAQPSSREVRELRQATLTRYLGLQTSASPILTVRSVTTKRSDTVISLLSLQSHNSRLSGVRGVRDGLSVCTQRSSSLTEPVTLRSQSPAVASLAEYLPIVLITQSAVKPLITNPCSSQRQHITTDNPS